MAKKSKKPAEVQACDSCLFIELLTNHNKDRVDATRKVLEEARRGGATIVLSNLVLAEVRPAASFTGEYGEIVTELLETDLNFVQWYGLTRTIALRAREIGAKHDLSPQDAIHIATAVEAEADVFFTFDGKRKQGRRIKHPLALTGMIASKSGKSELKIETPRIYTGPLFEGDDESQP